MSPRLCPPPPPQCTILPLLVAVFALICADTLLGSATAHRTAEHRIRIDWRSDNGGGEAGYADDLPALSDLVERHLTAGGQRAYRAAKGLRRGVYYNPLTFFSHAHATYKYPTKNHPLDTNPPRSPTLDILRRMGLYVPGIDRAEDLFRHVNDTDPTGCHGDKSPTQLKGERSTFLIYFTEGTPQAVRNVMSYTGHQWARYFASDVEMRVCFQWKTLEEGTLGATSTNNFINGTEFSSLKNGVMYPPALGSALQKRDLLGKDDFHVVMMFNNQINWHYDRHSFAAADRFDLATTILHELTHGLFFTGTIQSNGVSGASFRHGQVGRFDQFLQVEGNISVARSCSGDIENGKENLFNAIPSPNLRLTGTVNDKKLVLGLHAPRVYASGSSIYHFIW